MSYLSVKAIRLVEACSASLCWYVSLLASSTSFDHPASNKPPYLISSSAGELTDDCCSIGGRTTSHVQAPIKGVNMKVKNKGKSLGVFIHPRRRMSSYSGLELSSHRATKSHDGMFTSLIAEKSA